MIALNSEAFIDDPYRHYAWLREESPLHHDRDLDLWYVSRYDDVAAVLRDPTTYSSSFRRLAAGGSNPFSPGNRGVPPAVAKVTSRFMPQRVLSMTDPPQHQVLRRKVGRAFSPRAIAAWKSTIDTTVDDLVDTIVAADGAVDLIEALAAPLPTTVIAEMLGVPPERNAEFKSWTRGFLDGMLSDADLRVFAASSAHLMMFFARAVRQRRRDPKGDLISMLVADQGDDLALTFGEMTTFCALLLVAGNETTTNLVGNALIALLERPDIWDRLRDDPTLVPVAVEESLRFDPPAQALLRVTTRDVVLHDVTVPEGSRVLAFVGAANRDPRVWDDPGEFRLDRGARPDHLGFGAGVHHCIGVWLARLEVGAALTALVTRLPDLRLDGSPVLTNSSVVRGVRQLPVTAR